MKNSVYPEKCYSSQCGLCVECTNAIIPSPQSTNTLSHPEVLEKFEKPRLTEMGESYMNNLIRLNGRETLYDYITGAEKYFGIIPETYIVDESYAEPSFYKIQSTPHTLVCDTPLCKAIFDSIPPSVRNRHYPQFPVYSRRIRKEIKNDVPCNLCHTCVSSMGEPRI